MTSLYAVCWVCEVHVLEDCDVECSECSDLASLLDTPSISPCQPTTTRVTGSSVVFDFYDSYNLQTSSCSCSVMIPSTVNFELSMYRYYGMGIDTNPGCGSKIEVNSSRSGSLTMECRVFGSISMLTGDKASVTLSRDQNADSRYCMITSTKPPFIMDIECDAVGSPPTTSPPTTTTSPKTTTLLQTTTVRTTMPKTTTTTTTDKPTTTPETTTQRPTTIKTTTATQPITTTTTKTTPTTTKPTSSPQVITTTTTATTTQPTTTTKATTTTYLPTTPKQTTARPTTTTLSTSQEQTTTKVISPAQSTSTSSNPSSTTQATGGKTEVGGQSEDSSDKNLVIIIPVVVGIFFLLLLVVLVVQLSKTCRRKERMPKLDLDKIRFGQAFPRNNMFQHPTDMIETTHYDSKEDLHGNPDRYTAVTNPIYIHEESGYLPDITDKEISHFTSIHTSESDKIISERNENNTHEAPLYAVVDKSNKDTSLDSSKMSDVSSKSNSDLSSFGMLQENERNLRQEESYYY
ncbi:uncharacterized protein [Argopecten irradians]|uniref:uncharacterized protein isoform X1 n=1 Tax=Argopecten irradians TaxID=31199 RepID=UPI00371ADB1C